VMNISHLAARQGAENLRLELDFCEAFGSAFSDSALKHIGSTDPQNFLNRFFSPKASRFFLEYAGYGKEQAQWDKSAAQRLTAALRHVSLPILGTRSFDESQLSAGGVPVSEVRPDTCESTRVPGLYLVGETLDVVGPCGGYNLHFAFTSGTLAGSHLAELAGGL